MTTLAWRPFGREETGWAVYEPLIEHEVGTACPATSPGFAERLGAWQEAHGIPATGELDAGTFSVMLRVMHGRRPFVGSSRQACPDPPDERTLATVAPGEGYGGKVIRLEDDALTAYRRMRAAFRREISPADPQLLTLFSGFRSPADDQARCERTGACGGPELALCSAHRTGRAMDLYLGFAPSYPPDSSADPNRLFQSRTAAYRWLVERGGDFGLQPYPFEPWHWEYVGQP